MSPLDSFRSYTQGVATVPNSIGIDLGTSNVKAVIVSSEGSIIASTSRPFATFIGAVAGTNGGVVEQDPEAVWSAVVDCLTEMTADNPTEVSGVVALGVCSQYSSIVGVDSKASATTPLIMWSDQRGSDHSWEIISRHSDAFATWVDRHGIPPVGGGLSLAHILHVQIDRPDTHASTVAYLEPMDYVTAKLTGRIAATQPSSFMAQLCDNRSLGAVDYDPDLVAMSGVDPSRLPPLVDIDAPLGTIRADLAEQIGLPAGIVVGAGTNDTATGAIAAGALADGIAGLAIGTTSVLVDTVQAFGVDLDHEIVSMPGPFRDTYLVMAENGLGGRVLQHTIEAVIHPRDALGDDSIEAPFESVETALTASPPGAGGVMFLPWLAGSMAPDSDRGMRGGFVNMSLDTGRVDMIRSVAEGIAHNLGWLLPHIVNLTGAAIDQVRFTGGGARITGWAQVIADILDRPVSVVAQPHLATARAAALLALVREGTLQRADLAYLVEAGPAHDPSPEHRALYDHRQSQFEACFEALQPIHTALGGNP